MGSNVNLISQIVQSSNLQGSNLEALKARLATMSEAELQAELSKMEIKLTITKVLQLNVPLQNLMNKSITSLMSLTPMNMETKFLYIKTVITLLNEK